MDWPDPGRDAYSRMSQQYIGLFDGADGWQDHDGGTALVRRYLAGLSGPVLDLGCRPGAKRRGLRVATGSGRLERVTDSRA